MVEFISSPRSFKKFKHGVEIGESLNAAYFAVAVECTVKYLASEGSNGKYFEAVKRVWKGRIGHLEKSGMKSELLRDNAELTRWKNDLEAALWDANVVKRLMNSNTRALALQKLRAFLGEAWALMGPSFLEVAAATINGAGELAAEQEAAANEEDKLVAGKGEAWALMGPSFIEAAAATSNVAGELAAEQEVVARVLELAANEEDKLVAGKEMMRQAGVGGKTSSPKDRALNPQRKRTRFASPGK